MQMSGAPRCWNFRRQESYFLQWNESRVEQAGYTRTHDSRPRSSRTDPRSLRQGTGRSGGHATVFLGHGRGSMPPE
jgi:hypothetical protein